ncbi:MAG: SET domain-containing protein [Bdellovibrionaceae bacterium]|nr:SET domain-containing protein [Pseudobdellovibrionaceae bacterium]
MSSPYDNPKAVVRRTRKYGRAVFAREDIRKGETIAVFDGPVLDDDFEPWTDDLRNHTIQVGPTEWRDSKGFARYLNHSCDPNCGIKNRNRVVAMRPIQAGEEITWDYEMTEKNDWWKMKCRCGSDLCRKQIGNYRNMPRKIREKYKGYISDWLTGPSKAKSRPPASKRSKSKS